MGHLLLLTLIAEDSLRVASVVVVGNPLMMVMWTTHRVTDPELAALAVGGGGQHWSEMNSHGH